MIFESASADGRVPPAKAASQKAASQKWGLAERGAEAPHYPVVVKPGADRVRRPRQHRSAVRQWASPLPRCCVERCSSPAFRVTKVCWSRTICHIRCIR